MDDLRCLADACANRPPRAVWYWSDYFDRAPKIPALPVCEACKGGEHMLRTSLDTATMGDCTCPCHCQTMEDSKNV